MDYVESLARSLMLVADVDLEKALKSLTRPKGGQADICSTLAFTIAKEKKQNPSDLAKRWAEIGDWPGSIKKAEAVGPYLNFSLEDEFWAGLLNRYAQSGQKSLDNGKRAIVEYPSVNPNKPWHVGHLRNALLGDCIANILDVAGFDVKRIDYIDDLGLQVAQSVWGQKNLQEQDFADGLKKLDHVIGRQYVQVAKEVQRPEVEKEVRELLKKLERQDGKIAEDAREVVEDIVRAQYETAFLYGVYHDALIFESDIMNTIFEQGMQKIRESEGIVLEKEGKNSGCLVVRLEGQRGFEGLENADKVLIRSDGTATYTGKDVAFQMFKFGLIENRFRFREFVRQPDSSIAYMSSKDGERMDIGSADVVVNVIGIEQSYPQQVISAVLDRMGHSKEAKNSIHLGYEHVVLPEGRFSGRSGTWMKKEGGGIGFSADELLEEVRTRAKEKITAEYTDEEKIGIAESVSLAAIRFSFLRTSANQKIVFDYDKALSLAGDSGPYIQYAYARAHQILDKAKEQGVHEIEIAGDYGFNEQEVDMCRKVLEFDEVIKTCAQNYQVHPMCEYALEIATRFNRFYTTTKVLSEMDDRIRSQRLCEVRAYLNLLERTMCLLGIPRLERM